MRTTIDERVKDVASKFGSQIPKSKLYLLPKELPLLPELLFHLRRGPLLGSIVGHEDERSVLRNLFLNASFDLSLLMVALRCLMHREGGTFEELPAHDLAMQSDVAVVLDHVTDVFIWLLRLHFVGMSLSLPPYCFGITKFAGWRCCIFMRLYLMLKFASGHRPVDWVHIRKEIVVGQVQLFPYLLYRVLNLLLREEKAPASVACRTLAQELTAMKFPAPRILTFKDLALTVPTPPPFGKKGQKEGSSQARYLASRLIPAHKDPPYEQEARFPQLQTLTREGRENKAEKQCSL
ncbi:unnamed protein product [Ilex paraguariensis]|uniref:Protein transport protein SEC23 n=1 Tax=Ilex paraguariensis TaxID=185542 RepID=A0ABC8S6J8_9AQUA